MQLFQYYAYIEPTKDEADRGEVAKLISFADSKGNETIIQTVFERDQKFAEIEAYSRVYKDKSTIEKTRIKIVIRPF